MSSLTASKQKYNIDKAVEASIKRFGIIADDLTVRDVERISKEKKKACSLHRTSKKKSKDSNIESYEEILKNHFGTKVDIDARGDKGTIQIHFYNKEDFSRVYSMLLQSTTPPE